MRIAVIGAGAAGSAAARFLAKSNHKVVVFEQFEIGHALGSSHGTSRIIRKSYPDAFYAQLMQEVFPLWYDLQDEAQEQLYHETGLLVFGNPGASYFHDTRNTLTASRIPFEALGPIDAAKRFGGFHLHPDEEAIFQPQAGFLKADRVILANLRIAEKHGAEIRTNTKAVVDGATVNGDKFDGILICAGAWTNEFVPLALEPHLQHFAYFDGPMIKDLPVWVEAREDHHYGFPNYGRGYKIGRHLYGPLIEPNCMERDLQDEAIESITAAARERLGDVSLREAFTCLYTVAPNEDFRIGSLDAQVPTYYITGCSGHGFKFTVWFGWLAREMFEGRKSPSDYPRFLHEGAAHV